MTIEAFIKNRINYVFKNSILFSRNANEIRDMLSRKDNDGLEIIPTDKIEIERIDNLHDKVTFSYDDYAFSGCPFIHDIVLPDSIVQLTNQVFLDCENLTTVTLGENLKLLGAENFQSCSNITSVTCKAEIPPTCINPIQFTSWVYDNAVLKVSQFSIDKYRNAPG